MILIMNRIVRFPVKGGTLRHLLYSKGFTMRANVLRAGLLTATGVLAAVGLVANPQTAHAGYPEGGTYACNTVQADAKGSASGFECLPSPGFPARGPVDKFYLRSVPTGERWFCFTGIATIGISAAPQDVVANGCTRG